MAGNSIRAQSKSGSSDMISDEPLYARSTPCTVKTVYLTNIAGYWRNVSVVWYKSTFTITVDAIEGDPNTLTSSCKVEIKPWYFWSRKGYKSFQIDVQNHHLDVYWDLRSAKFSGSSPEPCSDYYVCIVSDEEVVLLLGDNKKKAYTRTKKHPALVEPMMSLKREVVYAKKSFATRATFPEGTTKQGEHEVVVESSTSSSSSDPKEDSSPEMWISIDGIVLIHVKNLQWKFRGNETVMLNNQSVQVLWDVHGWLFCAPGCGYGCFTFKPGAPEVDPDMEGSTQSGHSDSSGGSMFYSTCGQSRGVDFCLILQAWKIHE